MMKCCPKCNGHGFELLANRFGRIRKLECDICNGKGYLPMTNEEWLRSCQPQELIRFLMNVAYGGQIRNVQKRTFDEEAEKWSKWLKEKHTE